MNLRWYLLILCFLVATPLHAQRGSARSNTGAIPSPSIAKIPGGGPVRSLSFEVEFTEPSGNGFLDAKETGRLKLIISNIVKVPARNVIAKIVPLDKAVGITFIDSIKVGSIPVNGTQYAIFYFTASTTVPSQTLKFQIEVIDENGFAAEPRQLAFSTRELNSSD